MCLSTVYYGKRKQAALDKLPKMGTYWKVVDKREDYYPPYQKEMGRYHSGTMSFKTNRIYFSLFFGDDLKTYKGGVHIYRNKADAKRYVWNTNSRAIVPVKVDKAWITTIGSNDGDLTICASKAIFPKWIGKKK